MSTTGWVLLAVVNVPVYYGLGRVFFRDWDEFRESVRFWMTPDLISAFRGQYVEDWWAEAKLGLWVVSCTAFVVGEAYLFGKITG